MIKSTLNGIRRETRGFDIYSVFSGFARSEPASTVIYFDDRAITFGELAGHVKQLSEQLRIYGVGPGHRVIIQIPRSPSFVVAVLATMSVDAVFVPISMDEPGDRARFIEENVGASALIRTDDDANPIVEALPHQFRPLFPSNSSRLAYILHTSGSTGTPKGVAIPHRALMNCLEWHSEKFQFAARSVISHLSLPTFDLSIAELFLPLVYGGAMVIPSANLSSDLLSVIGVLAASNVSIIQMVPTVLGRFLRALRAAPALVHALARFSSNGHMICNGESLPDSMRRTFYNLFPTATLHNCYGPTEACVAVTEYVCQRDDRPLTMYIGAPVPNVDLYIVNELMEPVLLSGIGELLIGGEQNAVGYVANPKETQRRFLTIQTETGDKVVYRTGDLVRRDGDLIEFVRRADTQVKYRSVRLELEEVEAVAHQSALCDDARALVLQPEDEESRQELVLLATPETLSTDDLSDYLSSHLPRDRRPSKIIPLPVLPSTRNGKVDRDELRRVAQKAFVQQRLSDDKEQTNVVRAAPPADRLAIFLYCLRRVSGQPYVASDLWGDCNIDSLTYIDLDLHLLEAGLMLDESIYDLKLLTLAEISHHLVPATPGRKVPPIGICDESLPSQMYGELTQLFETAVNRTPRQSTPTIVLHSSLLGLGPSASPRLAEGVLSVLSDMRTRCNFLLPAFTPTFTRTRDYQSSSTKSETGVLAMRVLERLDGFRSRHPIYSFAIIGPDQNRWRMPDWWRASPFGVGSQFEALADVEAVIVTLGTYAMAHPHRCEYLASVPYMSSERIEGRCDFGQGYQTTSVEVYLHDIAGSDEERLLAQDAKRTFDALTGIIEVRHIGAVPAGIAPIRGLEQRLVTLLRREPFSLLRSESIPAIRRRLLSR